MTELARFDLQNHIEWEQFYTLFSEYLAEVCDEEEFLENIEDLNNDLLNRQMIEQTLQEKDPYFVMKVIFKGLCIGLISYSYSEARRRGFINNFYVQTAYRGMGVGSDVYRKVEAHLVRLGADLIELVPVDKASEFYKKNGFEPSYTTSDGEQAYSKYIR